MRLDEAVSLQLRTGQITRITTVEDAGKVLLKWPKPIDTAKHRAARRAVLKVLEGQAEASRARKALQEAAKEAGILAVNRW